MTAPIRFANGLFQHEAASKPLWLRRCSFPSSFPSVQLQTTILDDVIGQDYISICKATGKPNSFPNRRVLRGELVERALNQVYREYLYICYEGSLPALLDYLLVSNHLHFESAIDKANFNWARYGKAYQTVSCWYRKRPFFSNLNNRTKN